MKITISLKKGMQENANDYFEASKKAKRKLIGLEKAIKNMDEKLRKAKEKREFAKDREIISKKRKRAWFEKFRWFFTSGGFLVIGGRDATGNEALVKKYMDENDLYFHAEIHGAPHVVLKKEGKEVPQEDREEAAIFAASFSSAWKEGIPYVNVYSVRPEQVSKEAPSGESLGKGAFVIKGQREWFNKARLECSVGIEETGEGLRIISGPKKAIEKKSKLFFGLKQGKNEKSEIAKKLKRLFEEKLKEKIDLDEIVAMLPAGNSDML